jgi:GAF domain-containing protein
MDNRLIVEQVKSLIEGTNNNIGALGNVAALLKETFDYYFWVGFYVVRGDELVLGPFQGPVACYSIKKGRGVCGTAWAKAQTLIVPNVHQFPGHIACSSRSNSEIVVPVFRHQEVIAVIDVDSERLDAFHDDDRELLEAIAKIIEPLI